MSNAHRNEDHLADHEIVLAHIAASRGWAHGELTGSAEQVMGEARDRVDVERVVGRNGVVWRIPDSEDRQSTVVIFLQRSRNPFATQKEHQPKHDKDTRGWAAELVGLCTPRRPCSSAPSWA